MAEKVSADDFLKRIEGEVTKELGAGVFATAQDVLAEEKQVIPLSPALDVGLAGGIPEGSWVSITGPAKAGKSTTVLTAAASAQRPENGGRIVVYGDVEGRLKKKNLMGIRGLDLSPEKFRIIRSTKEKILSSQDFLTEFLRVLRTIPKVFLIIDSVSALAAEKEMTDGIGTETRGGGNKLVSQFCRISANVVPVMKSVVAGITHQIHNTSGMGAAKVERVAEAWKYQADIKLKLKHSERWNVGSDANSKQIGLKVNWLVEESALGPPGANILSYIRFGVGVDTLYELIDMGTAVGLIAKSGNWLSLAPLMQQHPDLLGVDSWSADLEKGVRGNGGEKFYKLLVDHPAWAEALRMQLVTTVGGVEEE